MTALQEGKLGPGLKQFLTDEVLGKGKGKDSLLVVDKHLGTPIVSIIAHLFKFRSAATSISKKLSIKVTTSDSEYEEIWRGIRGQLAALLDGLDPKDLATMSLGLGHSLSRYDRARIFFFIQALTKFTGSK